MVSCSACEAVEERQKELKERPAGARFHATLAEDFDLEAARAARAEAMAAELAQGGAQEVRGGAAGTA